MTVCAEPGCPRLRPCPIHNKPTGPYGTRNPNRDLVAHNRWARQLKRQYPYCQRCGRADRPLHAHHTHGIHDPRGQVLCDLCHGEVDPHAR